MHFYTFHPAKHKLETYQLKPLERLAYRELMDIYYDTEKPLTTNIDDLAWRMGYETDELKQALKLVLDKFFVIKQLKGDAEPMYHHPRLDYEIKAYQSSEKKNGTKGTRKLQAGTSQTTNEVQDTTSETTSETTNKNTTDIKKANMIQALRNQGVKANTRMSVGELQALFDEHCKQTTSQLQDTTNEVQDTTSPILAGKTINNKPTTNNHNINSCERDDSDETSDKTNPKGSETKQTTAKPKTKYADEINDIFEFWISTFGKDKNKTKLSDTRKRKITQRLEQGYTVDDIKTAIVNCSKSDYHISGGYTDIELICRDEVHIDRFLAMKPKTTPQPTKFYGTPADPLAVNQKSFPTPENWEQNLAKLLAQQNQAMGLVEI